MKLRKKNLGEICKLTNGKAYKPSDWALKGVPIVRIQNLNDSLKPFNYWSGSLEKQVPINDGDVLLAWSGTPGTSFGAHYWNRGPAVLNQHIFRVDLDLNEIKKEWAVYAINYQLQKLIDQAHGGVGLKHVTKRMVEDLIIPLPSINEQSKRIKILDKADAIFRKRQKAVQLVDDFLRSVFPDMFGEKRNKSWQVVTLESVCTQIKDGTHKTPNYVSSGIPFLTVKNIVSGELDFRDTKFISNEEHQILAKRAKPEKGDILVSKDGTIGVPCVIDTNREFSIFVSLAILKLKQNIIEPVFLADQFRSARIQRQIRNGIKGIAIRHLHLADFKLLELLLPPISVQREYVKLASRLRAQITKERQLEKSAKQLFNSLMQSTFGGEL